MSEKLYVEILLSDSLGSSGGMGSVGEESLRAFGDFCGKRTNERTVPVRKRMQRSPFFVGPALATGRGQRYTAFMDFIHVLILAIVEGITEFLPISSTGHLMLASELLRIPNTEFLKTFEIAIQAGAVLAVVAIYPRRLFTDRAAQVRVAAAFIPTGIIGLLVYKAVKTYLFGHIPVILIALGSGGILMIIFERYMVPKMKPAARGIDALPLRSAVGIGIIQALSFIPGVSRAAATIFGGMYFGLTRAAAVEFSFLLAVPTMASATGLDLVNNYRLFSNTDWASLGIGFVASFAVAGAAIALLVRFVRTHTFLSFAYYRMIVALAGIFIFF